MVPYLSVQNLTTQILIIFSPSSTWQRVKLCWQSAGDVIHTSSAGLPRLWQWDDTTLWQWPLISDSPFWQWHTIASFQAQQPNLTFHTNCIKNQNQSDIENFSWPSPTQCRLPPTTFLLRKSVCFQTTAASYESPSFENHNLCPLTFGEKEACLFSNGQKLSCIWPADNQIIERINFEFNLSLMINLN